MSRPGFDAVSIPWLFGIGLDFDSNQFGQGQAYIKVDRNGTATLKASPNIGNRNVSGLASGDLNLGSGGFQVVWGSSRVLVAWKIAVLKVLEVDTSRASTRYPWFLGPACSTAGQCVDTLSFWGYTFPNISAFAHALPFRTIRVGNSGNTFETIQYLINATAFDRASDFSADFRSFSPGWNFSIGIGSDVGFVDVVGLNLALEGVLPTRSR